MNTYKLNFLQFYRHGTSLGPRKEVWFGENEEKKLEECRTQMSLKGGIPTDGKSKRSNFVSLIWCVSKKYCVSRKYRVSSK